jgi:hypothetical protein
MNGMTGRPPKPPAGYNTYSKWFLPWLVMTISTRIDLFTRPADLAGGLRRAGTQNQKG